MANSLGNLIRMLRKEQGISQGELSKGLCSVANLSKIDLGEREPGQMLFEALITRLGKDSTKWELLLPEEERYEDSIAYCEKGLQELVQKRSTYFFKSFLSVVS